MNNAQEQATDWTGVDRGESLFSSNNENEQEPPPAWLLPRKVAALSDYLPPQVMEGMLYLGCRFVFGGPPKARKSWLLMLACYCVANGLPFLGIPTKRGKVVYLNFELLEGECRARFFEIHKAIGKGNIDNIEVIQLRDRTLSDNNLLQLQKIIADASFCLCAFDPVYKLLNGRDERVGKDIAPVLDSIAAIAGQYQCSVGFSAHFAKGNQAQKFAIDRISGSNYFARDADVILVMTELNEPDSYGIEIIQRSFSDIKPFAIRWKAPLFVRDESLDPTDIRQPGKDPKKLDPLSERMLTALYATNYEDGGLPFMEFWKAVQIKGKNGKPTPVKSTFYEKLDSLIKQKAIEKSVATGKYMLTIDFYQKRAALLKQNPEASSD